MRKFATIFMFALMMSASSHAATVVELFTSQGCSSCPSADRALAKLAENEDVIALSCHITYWDKRGWKDTLGQEFCTDRQFEYMENFGIPHTYTPQMVVNGRYEGTGSNPFSVHSMMGKAADEQLPEIPATLSGNELKLSLPDRGGGDIVRIILAGFDSSHTEKIGSGENGGKEVTYVNAMTVLENIGLWDGTAVEITYSIAKPAENYVVLLQHGGGALAGASKVLKP